MMGETVDSLYVIFMNAPQGQKVETANTVFKALFERQVIDSLIQFEKSDKAMIVEAKLHQEMADFYFDRGLYSPALEAGKRAEGLLTSIKDDMMKCDVLSTIANAHFRLGNYEEALNKLLETYRLDKKIGDDAFISSDLNSLAAIYLTIEQPVQGIKCINEAIAIERELKRNSHLAIRLGMASELFLLNHEPDKAMTAINEAYNIDRKDGRNDKAAVRLVQKAAVLENMSRFDEAKECLLKALPALEEANITYSLAVAYNHLGSIYQKLGNLQDAADCFKKALEQSIKCGSPMTECTAEYGLWQTSRDANPNVALLHLERYTALNDSMQNRIKMAQLHLMGDDPLHEELNDMSDNSKSGHISNRMLWCGALLIALLIAALAASFFAWRRNKSALTMQQQAQTLRSRFLANIGNALQNPLTVVMSAGQYLLDGKRASVDENKKTGEMIVQHGNNMLQLINQLLDIDKARSAIDQPDIKQGDIVMFTRMLVENHAEEARNKKVFLEFNCPLNELIVVFLPDCIRKIVHCLIDNAIKFTPSMGSVTVALDRLDADNLKLTVKDTGKGIPTEERARIFEPFTQSENGDDGIVTGVSLTLVKQLVMFMNGTIDVDSELNNGTTFSIVFPVKSPDDDVKGTHEDGHSLAERRIQPTGSKKQGQPLVLVAENNEDVAFFIGSLLQNDYDLRFAHDGQEALNNAQKLVPDLVITNIMMPVMDGKTLITKLRTSQSLYHIPIIALTSDFSEQERLSCIEAGADVVLVKPFNSTELKLQVRHLIEQRSKLREQLLRTGSSSIDNEKPKTVLAKDDKEFLNRLIDIIHAQMAKDDIDIDHIAAAMSLSPKQLRMRVQSITGMRPANYVLQVRLNYARRLIANDSLTLTSIASKCGFQTLSHFSKAFKQQFGMSPIQYRKYQDDPSRLQSNNTP
jgi:signal transduction histidine kinase/CheY-like chemotaxis protein